MFIMGMERKIYSVRHMIHDSYTSLFMLEERTLMDTTTKMLRMRFFVRRWVPTEEVYMQVAKDKMQYTLVDVVIPVHMQGCSTYR
jgi:hypothetical protein